MNGLVKSWQRDENDEYQLVGNDECSIVELAEMFNHEYQFIEKRKGESKRIIKKSLVNYTRKVLDWKPENKLEDWIQRYEN